MNLFQNSVIKGEGVLDADTILYLIVFHQFQSFVVTICMEFKTCRVSLELCSPFLLRILFVDYDIATTIIHFRDLI